MADWTEESRLDALHQLNLLDTPASENFDRITRMASQIFGLPIAAVSLTDRDRQWFKSRVGVDHQSIPREKAPCGQVAESNDLLVVPDLLANPCYADSILADSGIRFYAGAPLTTRDGFGLGALCVLGTEPREVTEAETAALADLALMVMDQIELQHAFGRIDPLSNLPNRTQFLDDLEDLGRDAPGERRLAVLVDLARTQQLDQGSRVMGASFIDDMVREAAQLIRGALGNGRTSYHVAATQFAFLAPADVQDEAAYVPHLIGILDGLRAKSTVRFVMTAAVGVAPFITGKAAPADVLRAALGAAQDARASQELVSIHSPRSDHAHRRSFRLLNDFGKAIEQPGQLRLMFQPRIDLATGRCVGAEALLRWRHPELGEVGPGEFMPIVEQTALARPATAWVLNEGLRQLGAWQAKGLDVQLSINVAAPNLEEADFAEQVQLHLLKHGVRAESLELEVTESAVMEDAGQALGTLAGLDLAGIRIAIDDFGTGYSSLAYLQKLPAHVVKIDQSFIRRLEASDRDQRLVRSMISLSHDLGYRVVAEGVETAEAAELVRAMGCEEAQGYFFARPMEADAFEHFLRSDEGSSSRAAA